jgi:hypothetical protein
MYLIINSQCAPKWKVVIQWLPNNIKLDFYNFFKKLWKKSKIIFLWKNIPLSSSLFVRSEKKMEEENAKKEHGSSYRARVKLIY